MRIAILGTRGIPAAYGGFETFAEELSTRLVTLGHEVLVYRRHSFGEAWPKEQIYRGVRVLSAPTLMQKYLETPLHALSSFIDLLRRKVDVVLLCNAANAPFAWILRLQRLPVVINVDGIERKRAKWNALGRLWYRLGERCSVLFASKVVADAKVIADYYREKFRAESEVIAYGAEAVPLPAGETLQKLGLAANEYILYVSRLEPENNALGVIEAYKSSGVALPLVIVGDAPYADDYKRRLREAASPAVIFAGFQFGAAYRELRTNCLVYIQATEVGGTHPALVEAMAYGNCVLANDVPEHREVLGEAGLYYPYNDFNCLGRLLSEICRDNRKIERLRAMAKERAVRDYNWGQITRAYEDLFKRVSLSLSEQG